MMLTRDDDGNRPIHVAIRAGHLDAVKVLMEYGDYLGDCGENSMTCRELSVYYDRPDITAFIDEWLSTKPW